MFCPIVDKLWITGLVLGSTVAKYFAHNHENEAWARTVN
jgi:hypothetical protein